MWVVKAKLKHKCIISSRAKKYNVTVHSSSLNDQEQRGKVITLSVHYMCGKDNDMKRFIHDLKKDELVKYVESYGTMFFMVDMQRDKPVTETNRLMFLTRPVISDTEGWEHWQIGSYKREVLIQWIEKSRKMVDDFHLLNLKKTKLTEIYFPKALPNITSLQKKALVLAIEKGYYNVPKQTNLRQLAALSGTSLATYQKHLQKAESKIMPDLIESIK